jgi:pimeloyl-ACP methyl ester carboxylesterase
MTADGADACLVPPEPALRTRVRTGDGVWLNVEMHGPQHTGVPTVVLIHGWTCSIAFWAPVIRALRGQFRVVAYDQRGHGGSEHSGDAGCSIEALADDLETVLRETLPAGRRAVLAGHSMGGMAILAAALRQPVLDRMSGVLLASTGAANLIGEAMTLPLAGFGPAMVAAQHWLLTSSAPLGPVSYLSRSLLGYLTLGPDAPAELAAVNAAIIQACDRRARAAWGHVLARLDVTAGVRRLDVPTRVLVGKADRLTPPVHSRQVARHLPRFAGLTELPGIGHMTPLEAPGVVAALIRELAALAATAEEAGPDKSLS